MVDTPDGDNQPATVAERIDDVDSASALTGVADRTLSILKNGARDGSLALTLGGLLLWRGLRSIRRGRVRGVVPAGIGAVAVRTGLRKRRLVSIDAGTETTLDIETDDFDPTTEMSDEDGSVSDEAYAAVRRPGGNRSPSSKSESGWESEATGTGDDEERSRSDSVDSDDSDESVKPSADIEPAESISELDPRLDDDDEADLSETARADEPGEATGPAPEQAQPARSIDAEADPVSGEPNSGSGADEVPDRNGSDEDDESVRQDEIDLDALQGADDDTSTPDESDEDVHDR